jgi:hypothetical protein
MTRAQQADQVLFYCYLVAAVLLVIGVIQHGYLWARKSTPEPQRKQSRKVFFVMLVGLALIGIASLTN